MTEDEITTTKNLLQKLDAGFVPYPIFEQLARIVALPIIELIPLRLSDQDDVEVLLIERDANDPIFPHMLHTPGTVVRATDGIKGQPYSATAMQRLREQELGHVETGEPQFVGTIFHDSKRGAEQALLFWVEVTGDASHIGNFWNMKHLPESLIDSQLRFIQQAAARFLEAKVADTSHSS